MQDRINTRWRIEQIQGWADAQPWICGFNYLPSSAVNFADLWQQAHFDADLIHKELCWAQDIGFNALRINLSYVVWQQEGEAYLNTIDRFLALAAQCGLKVVLCLFDDCAFSGKVAVYGPQPAPVAGVHNSQAVGSPGREQVLDAANWPAFERYVKTIISRFATDPRLLFWDLYNEPGNRMIFQAGAYAQADERLPAASLQLMRDCFRWAREVGSSHPVTVAAWDVPYPFTQAEAAYQTAVDRLALELSDLVSFHGYCNHQQMAALIEQLTIKAAGRPLFCTEWMARHIGSQINDQLPLFHQHQIGAFNWGLVRGRTQTHLPWPFLQQNGVVPMDNEYWFHDLLTESGEAYDPHELAKIRALRVG